MSRQLVVKKRKDPPHTIGSSSPLSFLGSGTSGLNSTALTTSHSRRAKKKVDYSEEDKAYDEDKNCNEDKACDDDDHDDDDDHQPEHLSFATAATSTTTTTLVSNKAVATKEQMKKNREGRGNSGIQSSNDLVTIKCGGSYGHRLSMLAHDSSLKHMLERKRFSLSDPNDLKTFLANNPGAEAEDQWNTKPGSLATYEAVIVKATPPDGSNPYEDNTAFLTALAGMMRFVDTEYVMKDAKGKVKKNADGTDETKTTYAETNMLKYLKRRKSSIVFHYKNPSAMNGKIQRDDPKHRSRQRHIFLCKGIATRGTGGRSTFFCDGRTLRKYLEVTKGTWSLDAVQALEPKLQASLLFEEQKESLEDLFKP